METVVSTIVGIAVGGVLEWLVAQHYAKDASTELLAETARLTAETDKVRRLINTIGRALNEPGVVCPFWT